MTEKEVSTTAEAAARRLEYIANVVRAKGVKYGNSVDRVPVLFDVDPLVGVQARINDKLARLLGYLERGDVHVEGEENPIVDLIGYLAIYAVMLEAT